MRSSPLLFAVSMFVLTLTLVPAAQARTINVREGESIQAAVDQANAGDKIFVRPGTYHEQGRPCPSEPGHTCAVVVTKDDISLIARPKKDEAVILERAGDQDEGIAVGRTADPACLENEALRVQGSLVEGFTVTDFEDDGVFLFCVDDWRITDVRAIDDEEYGIFPSHVGRGRVDHSFASGANDTGIYVGQSHDVEIDHNIATDNVSGFEIENSARVYAHDNEAFGNTGGILSFALPGLDVKSNEDNRIVGNLVHDNDRRNSCLDPSDAVCAVPRGTGVLLVAADRNLVSGNLVTGNDTFGIAVASLCTALDLSLETCFALDVDPLPDGNQILSNHVTDNGTSPDPSVPGPFAADLAWDQTGAGNCWADNVFGDSFPSPLPAC